MLLAVLAVCWHLLSSLQQVPAAAAASRSEVRAPLIPAVWLHVADCESHRDWHINTGNGFYGGFQIKGTRADLMSPARQLALARQILAAQGPGAWPVCGPRAGLQRGD